MPLNECASNIPLPYSFGRRASACRCLCLGHGQDGGFAVRAPGYPTAILASNGAGASTVALRASWSSLAAFHDIQGGRPNSALPQGRALVAPHQSNPASMHCSSLMAGNLPASAIRRSSRPFILALRGCRPVRAIVVKSAKHLCNDVAKRSKCHLSNVLSEWVAVRENSTEPKGLGNVRKAFGELRNV